VLAAGRRASSASREALATLCQNYWYPLYAHVRRRGHRAAEAQDLIRSSSPGSWKKARYRSPTATGVDSARSCWRRWIISWPTPGAGPAPGTRRATAHPLLDFRAGEGRYAAEPAHELTPDRLYARRWALTLIDQALSRLRDEFDRAAEGLFERLKPYSAATRTPTPTANWAARLGMTEGAVKVAVHRLRRRCGNCCAKRSLARWPGPTRSRRNCVTCSTCSAGLRRENPCNFRGFGLEGW